MILFLYCKSPQSLQYANIHHESSLRECTLQYFFRFDCRTSSCPLLALQLPLLKGSSSSCTHWKMLPLQGAMCRVHCVSVLVSVTVALPAFSDLLLLTKTLLQTSSSCGPLPLPPVDKVTSRSAERMRSKLEAGFLLHSLTHLHPWTLSWLVSEMSFLLPKVGADILV